MKFKLNNPATLQSFGNVRYMIEWGDVFRVEAIDDNTTIAFPNNSIMGWDTNFSKIQYSLNNKSYSPIQQGGEIKLKQGQSVSFVSTEKLETGLSAQNGLFSISGRVNLHGDLVSFYNPSEKTLSRNAFYNFFASLPIVSAKNLKLATNSSQLLGDAQYYKMFSGCNQLVEAPVIDIDRFLGETAMRMFENCSSLSKVVCLITEWCSDSLSNWLTGVSENGVFVKRAGVEWNASETGIPAGWTIEDYAE